MTTFERKEAIPKLQGYRCFACGTANPIGLNLSFYQQGGYICSDIILGKNHGGWENMAHGGIASTLLDEVMSWAMIYFKRVFFVTRRMNIKYLRPVPLHIPLTAKGKIQEEKRPLCKAMGLIQDGDGNTLARAQAIFAILPQEDLPLVPNELKTDMSRLFGLFEGKDCPERNSAPTRTHG